MPKYSQQILDDILTDAKHGHSLQEIAVRLNIPYSELFADYKNTLMPVKQFYDAGQAQGRSETDAALYTLAKNSSATAKAAYDDKILVADLTNKFREIDEL